MDVLERGGYDLVAIPFDRAEVVRTGHRAWLSWQKKVQGLRSVWFPAEEPEPRRIGGGRARSRAAGGSRL
jgi:hypothetical protein